MPELYFQVQIFQDFWVNKEQAAFWVRKSGLGDGRLVQVKL